MSDQGKSRQPIYRECRARWAFGEGSNGKLRILRSETKAETDHDSTEQNEHTVRQGQANTRVFAGGKQKERASVMKRRIETYSDAWFYWIFAGAAIGFTLFRWAAWTVWAVMG